MPVHTSLPLHFLGLGAQRAGTTTLHALLKSHPQLYLPEKKEVQFFSHHYQRGIGWYSQHFSSARAGLKLGEITPYYLFHPYVPKRIHAAYRRVRFVVLLRDPIERLLSHYLHSRRLGLERLPLVFALAAERGRLIGSEDVLDHPGGYHFGHQEQSYLARSRYAEQLDRYLKYFDRDQMLLVRSEDFFSNPVEICRRITEFLNLEPHPHAHQALPRYGATGKFRISAATRKLLEAELDSTYQTMQARFGMCWPEK